MNRLYFDNAATSWPKPEDVYVAVERYQRELGCAVGRGATQHGGELQQLVDRCRTRLSRLFNCRAEEIVFAFNGTDAINLAILGLLDSSPGQQSTHASELPHVVTTEIEHNSVLRPLRWLLDREAITVSYVSCDATGVVSAEAIAAATTAKTKLIALSHVSNVTGAIQPIAEVCAAARSRGVLTLIDAAQSAGHLPIDVMAVGCDLLACSGHKGLLGPLGTGVLFVRGSIAEQIRPIRFGGTGTRSEEDRQPLTLPDRFESGNHNAPGLVGLDAGVGWILDRSIDKIRSHEIELATQLQDGLADLAGITLYGPTDPAERSGVLSLNIDGFDSQELAAVFDDMFGIEARAGFHCAPRMHRALGTTDLGGTLRLSPGPFTTGEEVDAVITALREITTGGS